MSDYVRPHRWQPTRLPHTWDSPGKNAGVGCHFLLQCMKVKTENEVAQLCLPLSNLMNCSPPSSSIHGIFQARVLKWSAYLLRHWPQPCIIQWNYEPCRVGPPTMDGSWWRVLTKHGPLEKGMANHFIILALRTPWTVWRGKKYRTLKGELPRLIGIQILLEESGEIIPERMKRWSQSKNNTQLWMGLVIEARSDAVKSTIA